MIIQCNFCAGRGYVSEMFQKTMCSHCKGVGHVEVLLAPGQELVNCKFCAGQGYVSEMLEKRICPSCKGLGKRIIDIKPDSRKVQCKFCAGQGYVSEMLEKRICPSCDGLGFKYPLVISSGNPTKIKKGEKHSERGTNFQYDVVISFAGEDRDIVEQYANMLRSREIKYFYDKHEKSDLWGEDLYECLDDVYTNKGRYCVIFISQNYAKNLWTTHERKSAQARAFRNNTAYILPVKLDDTALPGIRETVGYIDLRQTSLSELVELTVTKLSK